MNTKDEIVRVFDGDGDSHPPAIFTQTGTVGQMEACGTAWPEANFDAARMADLALQPSKMFGFATVRIPFCITVDADAFGCEIFPGTGSSQPSVKGSRFREDMSFIDPPSDLITPAEFVASTRVQTVLSAADILKKHEDLFFVTGMNGPVACINNLLGMESVLMALMMEPERVTPWLDAVTPCLEEYSKVLSEVSDDVMIIEEGSNELVPADYFDMVFEPYLPKVIKSAQKEAFCTTHTCGDTKEVASRFAALGMDGISLEVSSDPEGYLELIGGRTLALGAVNPVETLLQKTPAEVVAAAKRSAELGYDFVTPECGVPPQTPNDNLYALAHYREL